MFFKVPSSENSDFGMAPPSHSAKLKEDLRRFEPTLSPSRPPFQSADSPTSKVGSSKDDSLLSSSSHSSSRRASGSAGRLDELKALKKLRMAFVRATYFQCNLDRHLLEAESLRAEEELSEYKELVDQFHELLDEKFELVGRRQLLEKELEDTFYVAKKLAKPSVASSIKNTLMKQTVEEIKTDPKPKNVESSLLSVERSHASPFEGLSESRITGQSTQSPFPFP